MKGPGGMADSSFIAVVAVFHSVEFRACVLINTIVADLTGSDFAPGG